MSDIEQEPFITEEVQKPVKRTTLMYKIDPELDYFPVCKKATLEKLKEIRAAYNLLKVAEASAMADMLGIEENTQDESE